MTANPPKARRVTLSVLGKSCGSCVRHIRATLDELGGAEAAHVHLAAREVTVSFNPQKTGVDAIVRAIRKSGYAAAAPNEQE